MCASWYAETGYNTAKNSLSNKNPIIEKIYICERSLTRNVLLAHSV
jgi:hypothetical protein